MRVYVITFYWHLITIENLWTLSLSTYCIASIICSYFNICNLCDLCVKRASLTKNNEGNSQIEHYSTNFVKINKSLHFHFEFCMRKWWPVVFLGHFVNYHGRGNDFCKRKRQNNCHRAEYNEARPFAMSTSACFFRQTLAQNKPFSFSLHSRTPSLSRAGAKRRQKTDRRE